MKIDSEVSNIVERILDSSEKGEPLSDQDIKEIVDQMLWLSERDFPVSDGQNAQVLALDESRRLKVKRLK